VSGRRCLVVVRDDQPPVAQLRLAVGAAGWARGGGEYDDTGLCEFVVSEDGSGVQRRWCVRVPLRLDESGQLVAGEPVVGEVC